VVSAAPAACRHCGLATSGPAEDYCCFGCELAAQIAAEGSDRLVGVRGTLTFALLLGMIVMMFALFLYAEDVYGAPAAAGFGWMRSFYRVASAVLATPVLFLCGAPLARRALRGLRAGRPSMDLLILSGATAAYALSLVALFAGRGGVYFDAAVAALVLATLGRYLEASARANASRVLGPSLKLAGAPVEVRAAGADGKGAGAWRTASPATVEPGMCVRVAADSVVPVDLVLEGGPAEVSLGVLTGESAPLTLHPGDEVPAGAVPVASALEGIALRSARASTLERLADLARGLAARPSGLLRVADAFARALAPLVWLLAIGAFGWWAWRGPIDHAVVVALAVVLAACPCSYGIAAPLVHWLALRKALRHGALVRHAGALDALSRVRVVAFDKTGTLTTAAPRVARAEITAGVAPGEVAALVAALEHESRHPVGRALSVWAAAASSSASAAAPRAEPVALAERRVVVGAGIAARDAAGRTLALGKTADGRVALARDGVALAHFDIEEELRPDGRAAVDMLRSAGLDALVLTGDGAVRARAAADALGVEAHAGLSAADKVARLQGLGGRVAMVGDGLNDAPALAGETPSFAVEGGSGLARGLAQVTLLRDDLRLVPWTLGLARRALGLVRRLLALSTGYNLVFLALAMTGLLRPVWAGASMLVSSLVTLAAASRVAAWPGPPADEARP
jgi:P-type E1-E2 ATPase